MPKLRRWVSVTVLCCLILVYFVGFLCFRSAASQMRENLKADAGFFSGIAAFFFLDSWEYALALGGLFLVTLGAAVEYLVARRWIAVTVYVGSAALYLVVLFLGYCAIAAAVSGVEDGRDRPPARPAAPEH